MVACKEIKEIVGDHATYVHCYGHVLKLVICDSLKSNSVVWKTTFLACSKNCRLSMSTRLPDIMSIQSALRNTSLALPVDSFCKHYATLVGQLEQII